MKLKKIFLWTLAATMAVSGPVFVTSCTDNNDNPVSTENDDEMPDVEVTPTTDQLTVTSNKTLYILYDYHPNKSTVGKDCIISHLLARFSDKKIVTNEASIADMKEGDYMLLYLEDPATADNEELRDATRKFINQGGIVMFAETPAVNMETLLNHGSWEELPVMPDDQDKLTDPMHVYFYPTYCPTFYNAKFDNFNTDQSEDITDYWLGKFADKVITETEKWVEEAHNNKPAQVRTRRNSEVETYISNQNRAMHLSVFGSYYFPNDFYANAKANLGQKTNYFDIYADIWPMKVTDNQGNVCRYFYGEIYGTLSFGNACLPFKKGKDFAYTWTKGAHIYKVNEIWGHYYEWQVKVDGVDASKVDIEQHSPSTSEQSGSTSEGISYNISGSVAGGYQNENPAAMATLSGGANINRSFTTNWTDVTYEDHTVQYGKNYVGGKFNFRECEGKYAAGNTGNVGVRLGAQCARESYMPNSAFLIRVNDATSNIKLNFTYWVEMVSYRAFVNSKSQGDMDKRGFLQSWDCPIDLSGIKYADVE